MIITYNYNIWSQCSVHSFPERTEHGPKMASLTPSAGDTLERASMASNCGSATSETEKLQSLESALNLVDAEGDDEDDNGEGRAQKSPKKSAGDVEAEDKAEFSLGTPTEVEDKSAGRILWK